MIKIVIEIDSDSKVTVNGERFSDMAVAAHEKNVREPKKSTGGKKVCQKCGNPFIPVSNRQQYCSLECGMKPAKKTGSKTHTVIESNGVTEEFHITEEQKKKSQSRPYRL